MSKGAGSTNNTGLPNWGGNIQGLGNAMAGFTPPAGSATAAGPGTGSAGPAFTPPAGSATAPGGTGGAQPWTSGASGGMPTGYTPQPSSPYTNTTANYGNPGQNMAGAGGTQAGQSNVGPDPNSNPSGYNALNTQLTTAPMQAITNEIQGGGASPQTQQAMGNLLNTTGANNWMNQAAGQFNALGGPQGTANYQGVYNNFGQPGANQQNLSGMASGSMVGQSNPYTTKIAQQAEQDAMSGVNQMFAAGGRYGSGMDQGAVAKAISDANNQYLGNQYNTDVGNQLTANQQIGQEQIGRGQVQNQAAQGVGQLQQWGATGLGSLGNNSMQNYLNAQANAGQIGNTATANMNNAFGNLNNVQNNKLFDSAQQLNVGNQTTAATQAQLNDLKALFGQNDMSDWSRATALGTGGTSLAGNYGTQASNTTQTSSPGIANILGGILNMF